MILRGAASKRNSEPACVPGVPSASSMNHTDTPIEPFEPNDTHQPEANMYIGASFQRTCNQLN